MFLNLKLSQARALSHLANIKAKLLGNAVLARRDSFLARSKVAGDQQLRNFLRTYAMTHTSLFAGQVTSVAKELAERKKRTSVVFNKRAAASSTPAGRHDHPQSSRARAQPARPVTHLSPCQSLQLPWRQPSAGVTKHLEARQRGLEQDQKSL